MEPQTNKISEELIRACDHYIPDLRRIRQLIQDGANVNACLCLKGVDGGNETFPLLVAVENRYESVVRLLLQQPGIQVNQVGKDGRTAFHAACSYGNISTVQILLQQPGTDINQANKRGKTPLHAASGLAALDRVSIVRLLLQQPGIQVNQADNDGRTPFHAACLYGNISTVQILLQQPGIEINQADQNRETPLHMACCRGRESIVRLLLQQPGIQVNRADKDGETLLHVACKNLCKPVVEHLIQHLGIDVNQAVKDGYISWYIASKTGSQMKSMSLVYFLLQNMALKETCNGPVKLVRTQPKDTTLSPSKKIKYMDLGNNSDDTDI